MQVQSTNKSKVSLLQGSNVFNVMHERYKLVTCKPKSQRYNF